jgi:hypothetical protein
MLDPINLLLSFFVFSIYAAVCGVAILFTFSLDLYLQLDERMKLNIIASRIVTPLESTIISLDDWLKSHNRIIGPALIVLSMIDMKLFFDIIYKL